MLGGEITPEQDKAIVEAFPKLYRVRHTTRYGLQYGLQISPGWYDLIWNTSALLEACLEGLPVVSQSDYHALQIKQKFAGLRFYMSKTTEEMDQIIAVACEKAETTCEVCGANAELIYPPVALLPMFHGWMEKLCPVHFKERAERDNWKKMVVPEVLVPKFNQFIVEVLE